MTIRKRNAAASGSGDAIQRARPKLEIVWRPVEAIKADPENPRLHSPKQVRQLVRSIKTFGFNVPVLVDRELRVIAGHGRLLACRKLGWTEVPTIAIDHLSEAQVSAFRLADNRLAQGATWNEPLLARQLKGLSAMEISFDIEATGFEVGEIELRIVGLEPVNDRGNRTADRQDARSKLAKARGICREGEWWLLGPHRVHCGGALDPAACATLMAEEGRDANPTSVCLCVSPTKAEAIIRHWQTLTGGNAHNAESGASFNDVAVDRLTTPNASPCGNWHIG